MEFFFKNILSHVISMLMFLHGVLFHVDYTLPVKRIFLLLFLREICRLPNSTNFGEKGMMRNLFEFVIPDLVYSVFQRLFIRI